MRQLLVQNELQRAWRMVGFESQPIITASTLDFILSKTPLDKTTFATAGGARYQGTELRGAIMVNYAKTESEMKSDYQDGVPSASMKLQDFISAPCIVINSELINRHTLIKYVANKLGGAHYDPRRTSDDRIFTLMDSFHNSVKILDKPAIFLNYFLLGKLLHHQMILKNFLMK